MCLNDSVIKGQCPNCKTYRAELREAQEKLEAVETFKGTFDRLGVGSHQQVSARYVYEELDRILKGGE